MMKIRPLQQDDAAFLCSIFRGNPEYYGIFFDSADTLPEWSSRVGSFLRQDVVCHFIMEENGNQVGWISFADTGSAERELCILVIRKEDLRRGCGTRGLSWLIEKSKEDHLRALVLNVNQSNARAIRFYRKFGFEIVGEEIIPECNEAVNLAQYKMRLFLE